MFRAPIRQTILTDEVANDFFKTSGGEILGDYSLSATIRALICPRMSEGDSLGINFYQRDISSDLSVDYICSGSYPEVGDQLLVYSIRSANSDYIEKSFKHIEEVFPEFYKGYQLISKVTDYFKKSFPVLCFANPELKSTVVFCENLDLRKLHYLQRATLIFFPWYYDPKKGVTEDEMALLESLGEQEPDKYLACIAKFAEAYDFRTARIKKLLNGFETGVDKAARESTAYAIERLDDEIRTYTMEIGNKLKMRDKKCIELMGLDAKIATGSESSELMDYFMCSKNLVLESADSDRIVFVINGYLVNFDSDAAEAAIKNPRSNVYHSLGSRFTKEQAEKFATALFIDQSIRLRLCGAFELRLNGNISTISHYGYGTESTGYLPNTHLDQFACLGNYVQAINDCMIKRDYVSAIGQCAASVSSLAWADPTVMERFFGMIFGNGCHKCIELPDGTVVTPKKAVEWLESQEVADEPQVTEETSTEEATEDE